MGKLGLPYTHFLPWAHASRSMPRSTFVAITSSAFRRAAASGSWPVSEVRHTVLDVDGWGSDLATI